MVTFTSLMTSLRCLLANLLLLQVGVASSFSPASLTNPERLLPSRYTPPSPRRNTHDMATSNNEGPNPDKSLSVNMEDLRKRVQRQKNQYAKLLMEQSKYTDGERAVPESVHIILFHPDTPKQHVHTIEFPKNSGNNLILAFESGGDCVNFARMLRDLEFADPSVSIRVIFIHAFRYCFASLLLYCNIAVFFKSRKRQYSILLLSIVKCPVSL
mmetsp:Transcript_8864/g.19178  ORF Transcript_8864/g.19178 Transcript_8864/m.19178 type:complete len:213 (+) Transcript_8864:50-688(+)